MSDSLDGKYIALFERASVALAKEDRALERSFRASPANAEHYVKVGHGLTYWLSETTLAYLIFKEWLRDTPVAWEVVDLVVFDANGREEAAIETRWWNDSLEKTLDGLVSDVAKLRTHFKDVKRRYLLTFWWCKQGGTDYDDELKSAKKTIRALSARAGGLRYVDSMCFPTKLHAGSRGHFVLTAIRVLG